MMTGRCHNCRKPIYFGPVKFYEPDLDDASFRKIWRHESNGYAACGFSLKHHAEPERTERIYVASSWRNGVQPAVVDALRAVGKEVYDFRHPAEGNDGFRWTDVDPEWTNGHGDGTTTAAGYLRAINHPTALAGFAFDLDAMEWADTFVLVLPCGRSAHLELGWACGQRKRTAILLDEPCTPELMYRLADLRTDTLLDVLRWVGATDQDIARWAIDPEPVPVGAPDE